MVGLQAYLEREDGTRLVACPDTVGVSPFICNRGDRTALMRFIDEYGETVFNRAQCKVLLREWSAALEAAPPEIAPWMTEVAALIEECADGVHLYVRFSGD